MNLEQIKELIASLEGSSLKKIAIKQKDFELQLEKSEPFVSVQGTSGSPHRSIHQESLPVLQSSSEPLKLGKLISVEEVVKEGKFVTSPMVGTIYFSSSQGHAPFVKVGDLLHEDTVVCIVEAMKVMNEVKAGIRGTVAEIYIENAHPVEFGTKILRVVS